MSVGCHCPVNQLQFTHYFLFRSGGVGGGGGAVRLKGQLYIIRLASGRN